MSDWNYCPHCGESLSGDDAEDGGDEAQIEMDLFSCDHCYCQMHIGPLGYMQHACCKCGDTKTPMTSNSWTISTETR